MLLDVGPHLLDLHEVAFGEIVDVVAAGDAHGRSRSSTSGVTSQASLSCRIAMESRTEIEVFASDGVVRFDGRDGDRREIGANIRRSFAEVARGGSHPADACCGLHLQTLIEQAAQQPRRRGRRFGAATTDGRRSTRHAAPHTSTGDVGFHTITRIDDWLPRDVVPQERLVERTHAVDVRDDGLCNREFDRTLQALTASEDLRSARRAPAWLPRP